METAERNLITARLLIKVFGGAYSSIELNKTLEELPDERDRAYVSRLFYGVLSKNVQLEYILGKLTAKRPKPAVAVVIKMGIYMLRFMEIPDYAVINTQVELIKKLGKKELAGFVNAVLRRESEVEVPVKSKNVLFSLSVDYSCPEWIVKKLLSEYGEDFTRAFLSASLPEKPHVRINERYIKKADFIKNLTDFELTPFGVYADYGELKKLDSGLFTAQSLASCMAVNYYAADLRNGVSVLDLCAAPGGKSVYIAELKKAEVTACDVYPHRVNLIRSYAKRMGANLTAMENDATKFNPEFNERFDCVICDVPCSGIGVMFGKPDILINRKESDIAELSRLQYEIITQASRYVKRGGYLNYSTCTVFKEENEGVVGRFLAENADFEPYKSIVKEVPVDRDGFVRIYPQVSGADGFFVAKLRRKNV